MDLQKKKRAEAYDLLSELAAHPTMSSVLMMRPSKGGDAVIGPFVETTTLEAVLAELGKLAIQAGETLDQFFPESWEYGFEARVVFAEVKKKWLDEFYSAPAAAQSSPATDAK